MEILEECSKKLLPQGRVYSKLVTTKGVEILTLAQLTPDFKFLALEEKQYSSVQSRDLSERL